MAGFRVTSRGFASTVIWKPPDYVYFEDGGAVGDGTASDSGAIVAAVKKAIAQGRSCRATQGKTYAITSRLDLSSALAGLTAAPEIVLDGATIKQAAASYLFFASATSSETAKQAMTTAIAAGDMQVTLPTGHGASDGWAVGQYIAVQALNGVFGLPGTGGTGNLGYAREIKQVLSVSGDVLQVDSPFVFAYPITATAYSSGNSAYYSKVSPLIAPKIVGGSFVNTNLAGLIAGTANGYLARWEQCKNVCMEDLYAEQMGGGVLLVECIGAQIGGDFRRLMYQDGSGSYGAPWGYGVGAVGACRDVVCNLTGGGVRHLFTTLGNNFAGANVPGSGGGTDPNSPDGQWYIGGPMYSQVAGTCEGDPLTAACWDTHPYGYGTDFDVIARGGQVGLQDRALASTGRAVCVAQTVTAGVNILNTAQGADITVDVRNAAGTVSKGVGIAGANCTIRGRIRDNISPGVVLASGASNPTVQAHIVNNTNYGVQDQGATNPAIISSRIPKSTSQTVSVLNLGATGRVVACDLAGYGAAASGMSGTNATAQVVGCATDLGLSSSVPAYLGSTGGAPVADALIYRGGSNLVRTGAAIRGDKGVQNGVNVTISGKTSAQIDTAVTAVGVTPGDGMEALDITNHLMAKRINGSWYPVTLGTAL